MMEIPRPDEAKTKEAKILPATVADFLSLPLEQWDRAEALTAQRMLRKVRLAKRQVQALFKPIRDDLARLKRSVLGQEKGLITALDNADLTLGMAIKAQRLVEKEQAVKATEAVASAVKSDLPSPVKVVHDEPDELTFRHDVKWEVEDFDEIPSDLLVLVLDHAAVDRQVKISKLDTKIPGIRVWEEETPVVRL